MSNIIVSDDATDSLKTLLLIQLAVQTSNILRQTGKNSGGGNYSYYKQNDFQPIDRMALEGGCIVLFSCGINSLQSGYELVTNKQGQQQQRMTTYCSADATIRLQAANSPADYVEVKAFGFKVDLTSDKALGADTIARRYAYFHLFNIPSTEGDPDAPEFDVRNQINGMPSESATVTPLAGTKKFAKKSI